MKDEQSDPKRRERGFYHIKIRQYSLMGIRLDDKWTIGIWDGKDFEEFHEMYHENEVVEIDERRIEREPEKNKRIAELEAQVEELKKTQGAKIIIDRKLPPIHLD